MDEFLQLHCEGAIRPVGLSPVVLGGQAVALGSSWCWLWAGRLLVSSVPFPNSSTWLCFGSVSSVFSDGGAGLSEGVPDMGLALSGLGISGGWWMFGRFLI